MSETRVNMRKIVGLTDDLARLAPQGDRPRIGMGIGVAYAAGYHAGNDGGLGSLGGKGELGERDADAGRDDGPVPRDAGDGMHDAAEALPPAGEIPGLEGLYDCASGRCVKVRFEGLVPPPEGWPDACTPPPSSKDEFEAVAHIIISGNYTPGQGGKIPVATTHIWAYNPIGIQQAMTKFNELMALVETSRVPTGGPNEFINEFSWDRPPDVASWYIARALDPALTGAGVGAIYRQHRQGGSPYPVGDISVTRNFYPRGSGGFIGAPPPPLVRWPATRCSEIAYDAATARFRDGACGNDPQLPTSLQGEYSGFTLCDADGNKVHVRRTRYGIDIEQEKYGRITTLDANTYQVVNQQIK